MPALTRGKDGWQAMNATSGFSSVAGASYIKASVCESHQLRHVSKPTRTKLD